MSTEKYGQEETYLNTFYAKLECPFKKVTKIIVTAAIFFKQNINL